MQLKPKRKVRENKNFSNQEKIRYCNEKILPWETHSDKVDKKQMLVRYVGKGKEMESKEKMDLFVVNTGGAIKHHVYSCSERFYWRPYGVSTQNIPLMVERSALFGKEFSWEPNQSRFYIFILRE